MIVAFKHAKIIVKYIYASAVAFDNVGICVYRCWNPIGTVLSTVCAAQIASTRYMDLSNWMLNIFSANQSREIRLPILA